MTGVLPPSSMVWCANTFAAAEPAMRPASVPPVSTSLSISGCSASILPQLGPRPSTTLNTPGGNPASVNILASFKVVSGVYSDGLTTVTQPDASTAASDLHRIIKGWLNGVQLATMPIGVRSV